MKKELTEEQHHILREGGTERAFSGKYYDNKKEGDYFCAGCGEKLFSSKDKFDSGTGWPSFTKAQGDKVLEVDDSSFFMRRIESKM